MRLTCFFLVLVLGAGQSALFGQQAPRFGRFENYRPRELSYRPVVWQTGRLAGVDGLDPQTLARLQRNGLVAELTPHSLFGVTRRAIASGRPVMLTSDLVGELTWLEIGWLVRGLEQGFLAPQLLELGRRLRQGLASVRNMPRELEEGLRLARCYADVLDQLGRSRPASKDALVAGELSRIVAGRRAESVLHGRSLDYGRFRGRSAETVTGRYRRQLAWAQVQVGRPDVSAIDLKPFDARQTAALLLGRTLLGDIRARQAWERLRATISMLMGGQQAGDSLSFLASARQVFGEGLPLARLADAERWRDFGQSLQRLRGPGGRAGLALLGRRRIDDFRWIAELGWPNVGTASVRRADPGGLDLAAVFGSQRAAGLLLGEHAGTPHFVSRLREARKQHLPLPGTIVSERVHTLYRAGIHAMQALLLPAPRGGPLPRWRLAWRDRAISSALGYWLRLRNLPLTRGVLTEAGRPTQIVLEPTPHFYARLGALVAAFDQSLSRAGVSPEIRAGLCPLAAELDWMRDHAVQLQSGRRPRTTDAGRLADFWVRWSARPIHGPAQERVGERLFYLWSQQGITEEVRAGLSGSLRLTIAWPVDGVRVLHLGAVYAYRERKPRATRKDLPLPEWLRRSELIVDRKRKKQ